MERVFKKAKELHLYLDLEDLLENDQYACDTYRETQQKFETSLSGIIRTTIPFFLSFEYADRIFVHCNGKEHEITLGECEGTTREIKQSLNIQKLLFTGAFDWFNPYIDDITDEFKDQLDIFL